MGLALRWHWRQVLRRPDDAIMVLAGGMIMDREAIVRSLDDAPPWRTYEISEPRLIHSGPDSATLVYIGTAYRESCDPRIRCRDVQRLRPGSRLGAPFALSADAGSELHLICLAYRTRRTTFSSVRTHSGSAQLRSGTAAPGEQCSPSESRPMVSWWVDRCCAAGWASQLAATP